MAATPPTVAIVGRQNVGKSTLVNRLFGGKETIADELPGVTRDRIEVPVEWRGRRFTVVDTGGYVSRAGGIEALVSRQAERAASSADVVLLVGDAQVGVQEEDLVLARHLRGSSAPVLVDAVIRWGDRDVRFVDTAGLRRPGRMQGIDYYGLVRAVRAIDRAHVALLVLDATEGLTGEDKHVAERVIEAGRGLVVAANKWDLVPSGARDALFKELSEVVTPFARAPLLRTSAITGTGVGRLPKALLDVHGGWTRRVPTTRVNQVMREAQGDRPPPRGTGRFLYGTQVAAGPPTFVLFGGRAPDRGYERFLENRLRRTLRLEGVPIRMRFRAKRRKRSVR